MSAPRFGLRFQRGADVVSLFQIGGSGRVLLGDTKGKRWWSRPPVADWEVYQTKTGQLYESEDLAKKVADNLSRLGKRGRACLKTSQID